MNSTEVMEILLVEDNLGDVLLAKEALKDAEVVHHLNVVHDGVEAEEYLFRRGRFSQAPRPNLILLDLNLPRKNGRDVLSDLQADAALRRIPLVVLTSSREEQSVVDGCDPAKTLYMVKPTTFSALIEVFRQIQAFWASAMTN
ncbi:MAG: response regulator [Phycisphaerae bacterium]